MHKKCSHARTRALPSRLSVLILLLAKTLFSSHFDPIAAEIVQLERVKIALHLLFSELALLIFIFVDRGWIHGTLGEVIKPSEHLVSVLLVLVDKKL